MNKTDKYIDENRSNIIRSIKDIIAIPSVKEATLPGMPFGKPCADALKSTLELCDSLGFTTHNVDNFCGWAEIGQGTEMLGILCHLDVVPAGNGWITDPFTCIEKDGVLFGRGIADDKGPAIAAIYAIASLKDEKLDRRIRIIFGCDEESGWACMDRYKLTEEMPTIAFTPDATYPVISCERGIAHIRIFKHISSNLTVNGGLRANMVPCEARATVKKFDKADIKNVEGVSYEITKNGLEIFSKGVSAHGSSPEEGKNAFFGLFEFLGNLDLNSEENLLISKFNTYFSNNIDGAPLELNITDKSGPLSFNLGICTIENGEASLTFDIRYPISIGTDFIIKKFSAVFPDWNIEIIHQQDPHSVDENSELVTKLMDVYHEYTGFDHKPFAIGGGTYARILPGKAVAFGAHFRGKTVNMHAPDEQTEVEDIILTAKMIAAAALRLAKNN